MPKSKVSAFLSVLLVFASGAAMGAVGYRLYVVKTASAVQAPRNQKKMSPDEFRKRAVAHLKDAVKLNDQQLEEVQKIYDWQFEQFMSVSKKSETQVDQLKHEFEKQGDQIHEAAVAKIKAILTADQEPLYEKYLANRAAARAADHKRRQEQQQQDKGPHNDGRRPPPLP